MQNRNRRDESHDAATNANTMSNRNDRSAATAITTPAATIKATGAQQQQPGRKQNYLRSDRRTATTAVNNALNSLF